MARKSAVTQWRDWMGEYPSSRMCRANALLAGLNQNAHYRILRARGWGEPNKMFMQLWWPVTLMMVGPLWLVVPFILWDEYKVIYNLAAALLFLFAFLYLSQTPYRTSGFRKVQMPTPEMMVDYHLADISPQMIIGAIWGVGLAPSRLRALAILTLTGFLSALTPMFNYPTYSGFGRWFVLTISGIYLGTTICAPWPTLMMAAGNIRAEHASKQLRTAPFKYGVRLFTHLLFVPLIFVGIGVVMFILVAIWNWLDVFGSGRMGGQGQSYYLMSYLLYAAITLFVGLIWGNFCTTFGGTDLGSSHDRIAEIFYWNGIEGAVPPNREEVNRIVRFLGEDASKGG